MLTLYGNIDTYARLQSSLYLHSNMYSYAVVLSNQFSMQTSAILDIWSLIVDFDQQHDHMMYLFVTNQCGLHS